MVSAMKKPAKFQIPSEEKVKSTAEKSGASKSVDQMPAASRPPGNSKTGKAALAATKSPVRTQAGKSAKLEESDVVVKEASGAAARSSIKPLSNTDAKSIPAQLKAPVTTKKTESKTVGKPIKTELKSESVALKQDVKNVIGPVVKSTTDAATLAAIDTSGYILPSIKVPGRRGRKPKEFQPENDEVAALNAVERTEMKAADKAKAKDRKAKEKALLKDAFSSDTEASEEELEARREKLKILIKLGKERGFLTYAEINDHLPENIIDPEAFEGIIGTFNDMGIAIY